MPPEHVFGPLTAIIGPKGWPVAMLMKLKTYKKRRLTMTISRMRRHTPLGQMFACGVGSPT